MKKENNLKRGFLRLLLVFMITLQASAMTGQSGLKVTADFKGTNISSVLREIEKQTKVNFSYNLEQVAGIGAVYFSCNQVDIEEALKAILGQNFTFEISGNNIVIRANKINKEQKSVVKGRIVDEANEPLPDVSVLLVGTKKGTSTNQNGEFALEVNLASSPILKFQFLGMQTQQIEVKDQKHILIVLKSDNRALSEIVVVGAYGTVQKRTDMVGSAYQVDNEKMKNFPKLRVDQMLDGMVPGFKIDVNSDSPSSTRPRYNVRIRGEASLSASNEPLWIVDGTPFYTGDRTNMIPGMNNAISPLSFINADDIESITVLKDASSTSIYGANGANGVILITTKKGREGKPVVSLSARAGVSFINQSTKFKVLDSQQYLTLAREAYLNAGKDPALFPYQDNDVNRYTTTNTDWSDVFYRMGSSKQANMDIVGGTKDVKYFISGSYFQNKITVDGNVQERYSTRSNTEIKLTDKLSANLNVGLSYNINKVFNPGTDYYELLPILSPYNADGSYRMYNKVVDGYDEQGKIKYKTFKFFNKVAEREENEDNQKTFLANTNLSLKYDIIEGLGYTTQLGIDYQSNFEDTYAARTNWAGMSSDGTPLGYASRNHSNIFNWTNIHRLNYSKAIGKHSIGGLLGFEMVSKEYHTLSATGSGFVNDHIKEVSYAVNQTGYSSANMDRAMSFFAQANYGYDQRYFIVLNARKDGNSNFGKDVRWVNFGSIGASWNIHNEKFFKSRVINVLKLKASFGSNGNSRLGSQEAQGLYSYNEGDRYAGEAGGSMSACPNPALSWETTYMTNVGARVSLFNRLDIELEAYNNKTVNLLSNIDVSRTTGDTRVYRNIGAIRNSGIELSVSSVNMKGEFEWRTNLNMSHNQNRLLELYNGIEKVMGDKIWREGKDINTYYLIRWAGVDPRDGYPLWYDINGNLTRVYSTDNRYAEKSSSPILSGGISNSFSYKNFQLNFMLNYTIGGYTFSSFGRGVSSDGLNIMDDNQSVNQMDRWQYPGDNAMSPALMWGVSTKSTMNSTRFLHSKTNIRLQNISLSYQLPERWLKNSGVKNCSISFIGDNLGVWTPYDKTNRNSYKQSMSGYPMESSYTINLQVSF